jgi:hypothetical protein
MVRGGEEYLVQGRRTGSMASFVSAERMGSGFVFALASYSPLDLSRIQTRDFEQNGGYLSDISRRYYGNASRIMERFAPWVLYAPDAPYEYDIDYYSVGVPTRSASLAFCQLGYNPFSTAFAYSDMCRYGGGVYSAYCYAMYGQFWGGSCNDSYYWRRNTFVAQGNPPTPSTPSGPNPNVNLIEKLQPPDPEGHKSGVKAAIVADENLRRMDLPARPRPTTVDDNDFDRVYSIPRRAIENIKREERIERTPVANGGGFADERGARSTRGDRGGNRGDDEGLTRRGLPDRGSTLPSVRNPEGPRYDPPPRETPRHFDPPSTRNFDVPGRSGRSEGGRSYDPPPRASGGGGGGGGGHEGPRMSSPPPSSGGGARPAPAAQAPPVKEPASGGEKKKQG